MAHVAEFDQANNPYRSSVLETLDEFDAPVLADEIELRAFVGRNTDYYLRKWAPRLHDPQAEVGMNWAAFFLTAFWLAYRKMYRATFLFYGVMLLVWCVLQGVFVGMLGVREVPVGVNLVVNVMVALVCGLFGNAWYLKHTQRAIVAARAEGLEDDLLLIALAQRGGTSMLAAIGLVFVMGILIVMLILGLVVAVALSRIPH